jgi:hypothetical protein
MAYCDARELGVFALCLPGWREQVLMLTGRWDEAVEMCRETLNGARISPVNRLNPVRVLGTILARRCKPGGWDLLDEALDLADGTGEPKRPRSRRQERPTRREMAVCLLG